MSYIDADTLDECKEALRIGCQLEYLAGRLRCSPEHLANLLGLPHWKQFPPQQAAEFDLFEGTERLREVL